MTNRLIVVASLVLAALVVFALGTTQGPVSFRSDSDGAWCVIARYARVCNVTNEALDENARQEGFNAGAKDERAFAARLAR